MIDGEFTPGPMTEHGDREVAAGGAAQDRVAEIAERARQRNLARWSELATWVDLARERGLSGQDRTFAADLAHQLAGSAGTFGYQRATDAARDLEQLLSTGVPDDWSRAEECVAAIAKSLGEGPDAF
jgi:hypothetical protein